MPESIRRTVKCRPQGSSSAMTLHVDVRDFDTMRSYAEAAYEQERVYGDTTINMGTEVCGYAFVRRITPTMFQLIPDSVFITTQLVADGFSQPDEAGESEVMDRDDDFELDEPVYRLLWHSHMDGGAGFSRTDLRTHDDMGNTTALEAMFFLVLNINGDAAANFEQYLPHRIGTQISLVVSEYVDETYFDEIKQDFAAKRRILPPKKAHSYSVGQI